MDSIVVSCETCGQRFKAPASAVGRTTACAFCGGTIEIQAAASPDDSQSGFVDLSSADPDDDDAGDAADAAPSRRGGGGGSRGREGLFDLASGGRELPRRGESRGGGTARRTRGDTGRRGPPPEPAPRARTGNTGRLTRDAAGGDLRASRGGRGADDLRASRAGLRASQVGRRPTSAHVAAAKPLPWLWIGLGAGSVVLLVIVIGIAMASSAAEARREADRVAKATAEKKAKEEARARQLERGQQYQEAKAEADRLAKEDRDQFDKMNGERSTPVPDSEFRSERAAAAFVRAGEIAIEADKRDKAIDCFWRALDFDPDHKGAHVHLGHTLYRKPSERRDRADDERLQDLYGQGFLDALDRFHDRWFPKAAEQSRKVRGEPLPSIADIEAIERQAISAGLVELDKIRSDPYYAAVQQVYRNLKSQEILKNFNWKGRDKRPYAVFEASNDADAPDPQADERLEYKLAILRQLHGYFEETWAKPFGISRDESAPLKVLVLRDKHAFQAYNKAMGVPTPDGVLAYYEPINQWIVAYNGVDSAFARDEAAKRAMNDGVIFHEGTHQLVDAYVNKDRKGLRERIARTRWMDEGLCEFIGTVKLDHQGERLHWILEQMPRTRLEALLMWIDGEKSPMLRGMYQMFRQLKQQFAAQGMNISGELPPSIYLSIEEMARCLIYQHVGPVVFKGKLGPFGQLFNDNVVPLIYSQGVLFWNFCRHYENGKYWPAMMRYVRWEWGLAGEVPPPVATVDPAVQEAYVAALRMAFKEFELEDVNRDFWRYVDAVARKEFGRGIPSPPLPGK